MPAEVFIERHTGPARNFPFAGIVAKNLPFVGSLVSRIASNDRLACSDNINDGTANPLPVPGGSLFNYSWWSSARFAVGAPGGLITNLQFYTDGIALPDGIVLAVSTAREHPGYIPATGTQLSGNVLNVFNYPSLNFAPVNVAEYTITTPLTITGSSDPGVGNQGFGDFIVYQLAVSSADKTDFGPIAPINFYFTYEEL